MCAELLRKQHFIALFVFVDAYIVEYLLVHTTYINIYLFIHSLSSLTNKTLYLTGEK